jgi:hypothetical protein
VAIGGSVQRVASQRWLSSGDACIRRFPATRDEEGEVSCVPQSRGGRKTCMEAVVTKSKGKAVVLQPISTVATCPRWPALDKE